MAGANPANCTTGKTWRSAESPGRCASSDDDLVCIGCMEPIPVAASGLKGSHPEGGERSEERRRML